MKGDTGRYVCPVTYNMKKKIIFLMLSGLLVFGMAACSSDKVKETEIETVTLITDEEKEEILDDFVTYYTEMDKEGIKELIRSYPDENSPNKYPTDMFESDLFNAYFLKTAESEFDDIYTSIMSQSKVEINPIIPTSNPGNRAYYKLSVTYPDITTAFCKSIIEDGAIQGSGNYMNDFCNYMDSYFLDTSNNSYLETNSYKICVDLETGLINSLFIMEEPISIQTMLEDIMYAYRYANLMQDYRMDLIKESAAAVNEIFEKYEFYEFSGFRSDMNQGLNFVVVKVGEQWKLGTAYTEGIIGLDYINSNLDTYKVFVEDVK